MKPLYSLLDGARDSVRSVMLAIARRLNSLTNGRLHPNVVTITALLAHLPIAWLIAERQFVLAAILLMAFGLFDALDGALARLQQRVSKIGMLLDSVTDRMKEVIIYIGIALALVNGGQPQAAVWAVAACGASVLVSYINAWGEAVVAGLRLRGSSDSRSRSVTHHQVNQSFRSGLMSFDVRMGVLIIGLASGQLFGAIIMIAVLAWVTALERLINISRALKHVQD